MASSLAAGNDSGNEEMPSSKVKDLERYKYAERMAKALKPYLLSEENTKTSTRGRTKDKRICQLSAAYKYCIHLETVIKELCEKNGQINIPDDCRLVTNLKSLNLTNTNHNDYSITNDTQQSNAASLSTNNKLFKTTGDTLENDDESQILNHLINESVSIISDMKVTHLNNSRPNNHAGSKNNNQQMINNENSLNDLDTLRQVKNIRDFTNLDPTSPIFSDYLNDESNHNQPPRNKRRYITNQEEDAFDLNNNIIMNKENQFELLITNTPKSNPPTESINCDTSGSVNGSKNSSLKRMGVSTLAFSTPTSLTTSLNTATTSVSSKSCDKTDETNKVENKRHYFLRSSTNRLKPPISYATSRRSTKGRTTNQIHTETPTATTTATTTTTIINPENIFKLNSLSTATSSRSSSLTSSTKLNSNLSSSSSSCSHDLENIDSNKLYKLNDADEEMGQMYGMMSSKEMQEAKSTFNFI